MTLYLKECRRIATSLVYLLFVAIIIFSWFHNFYGITQTEIDMANGNAADEIGFDRPILAEPSEDDAYFGTKTSEENPEMIMTGVTRALLMEYENNSYATYPFGYYKAITLSSNEQKRVLEIICEITGLTEEQLSDLPNDYFPSQTGSIISTDNMELNENGQMIISSQNDNDDNQTDKTKGFISQVTYEHFKELMLEMETIIGENGSRYSKEMMITYFGQSDMSYEEAYAEYQQTMNKDKVTNGFARLFCDYMGLSLGLYPIFIVVIMWLKDQLGNVTELLYIRKVSSLKLVMSRYLATITMVILPVILLSFESLIPLVEFGNKNGITVDCFAYLKYIFWWLLPTIMMVCAVGLFFTLLTDSPIAILLQFFWWMVDKGVTGLTGDTSISTLMIRHNTLSGYDIIQDGFHIICLNRLIITSLSILLVILSVWILGQKRKGRMNAANIYGKCVESIRNKLQFGHTK